MVRQDLINIITQYASLFVLKVKGQSAMDFHDLNIHAEQGFLPILNILFNVELINSNLIKRNFPAIDLVDVEKGVAFQVTGETALEKILSTLNGFIGNELYKKYPTLYILIITEKKPRYNLSKIIDVTNGKFDFNARTQIIDYQDILRRVSFIHQIDVLEKVALLFEHLVTISGLPLRQNIQNWHKGFDNKIGAPLSFIDRANLELMEMMGAANIHKIPDKIPELQELFRNISSLEYEISEKEKERTDHQKSMSTYSNDLNLQKLLTGSYNKATHELEELKQSLNERKSAVTSLMQNIRRQKEFLDQIDRKDTSERISKARKLFEQGEFAGLDGLLNFEGREEYIRRKLAEKERRAAELLSLSDEEVLLALNLMQKQDWNKNIPRIKAHFDRSIQLAGYGYNAYQYSFFLEEINEYDRSIDIIRKTIKELPEEKVQNRAAAFARLGLLLKATHPADAVRAFEEATGLYELLFAEDAHNWRKALAFSAYQCGILQLENNSDAARGHLERAMLVLGTFGEGESGNRETSRLTYNVLAGLGYLHIRLGDVGQASSYFTICLPVAGWLAIDEPDEDLHYLLEIVSAYRKLLGGDEEKDHSTLIYGRAIRHFLKFHKEYSQKESYVQAAGLGKLGVRLLVAQEIIGAELCFRNALKIFQRLNDEGYPCLTEIAESLWEVAFIYMTRNQVKKRKQILVRAKNIYSRLAESEPVGNLSKMAGILDDLYVNSFIATAPVNFYKAYPFFDEAVKIYRELDGRYRQPDLNGWMQLLLHKNTMLLNGLDKTDPIEFYQEFAYFKSRIPMDRTIVFETSLQAMIYEMGKLLIHKMDSENPAVQEIYTDFALAMKAFLSKADAQVAQGVGRIESGE